MDRWARRPPPALSEPRRRRPSTHQTRSPWTRRHAPRPAPDGYLWVVHGIMGSACWMERAGLANIRRVGCTLCGLQPNMAWAGNHVLSVPARTCPWGKLCMRSSRACMF